MGFYGNITNTTRTTFTFDKIYPNRQTMDENAEKDGIFIGRYVLVEYDNENTYYYTPLVEKTIDEETKYYYSNNQEKEFTNFNEDTIYIIDGVYKMLNSSGELTTISDGKSNYINNFNIDIEHYSTNRGYDSTVWMKNYVDGVEKYIMIAELNTVVPTFDLHIDPPTSVAQKPYYDKDSNNIYYKLHCQPSWGLRIRPSVSYKTHELNNGIPSSSVSTFYMTETENELGGSQSDCIALSDETMNWKNNFRGTPYYYNVKKGSWMTQENLDKLDSSEINLDLQAAIYYNKAGFDPKIDTHSSRCIYLKKQISEDKYKNNTYYIYDENQFKLDTSGVFKNQDYYLPILEEITISDASDYKADTYYVYNEESYTYEKDTSGTFSDEKKYYLPIESLDDSIELLPTGRSGNLYVDNDSKASLLENDIQELSIMLPSIGDTIDEVWNLVYGPGDNYDEMKRNTHIEWEDASAAKVLAGHRLNNDKYDTDHIDTLEGCINTAHDLLGMIIKPVDNIKVIKDFASINENYIYYDKSSQKYYYKYKSGLNENSIKPVSDDTKYYTEVYVINDFKPNTNKWYKDVDGNYIKEKSNYYSHLRDYYNVNFVGNPLSIAKKFNPKDWYVYDADNKMYSIYTDTKIDSSINLYQITETQYHTNPLFLNGYYAIAKGDSFVTATLEDDFKEGNEFYAVKLGDVGTKTMKLWVPNEDGTGFTATEALTYDVDYIKTNATKYSYNDFYGVFEENTFFEYKGTQKVDATYTILSEEDYVPGNVYYTATVTLRDSNEITYEPGKYWILLDDNYVLDNAEDARDNVGYYIGVEATGLAKPTPIENKPYYLFADSNYTYYEYNESSSEYEQITEYDDNTKTYYIKNYNELYVYEDSSGVYKTGDWWNENVKKPDSVTLGIYKETYEWKELEDFAKNINTLNGMILKINQLLKYDDLTVKDRQTVQGCINVLNDYIDKINKLIPGQFLLVDELGRIHSASYLDDEWIKISTNADKDSPSIKIEHQFTQGKDTTSEFNINENGDTIELYTPILDSMGHVVANNKEKVTLPYSFKTIKVTNVDSTTVDDAASIINENGQIADNTQDILTFAASNKWIKLDNNDEDTIKIGHTIVSNTFGEQKNNSQTATPNFGSSFNIPVITVDNAGHMTAFATEAVTVPKGSYENTGNTGVITGIDFTPTSGAITSTSDYLGSITLGSYTTPTGGSGISTTSTLASALSTLDSRIYAEEQNRQTAISNLTVTGTSTFGADKTISAWSETNGKVSITSQDISIKSSQINDLTSTYSSTGIVAVNGQAIKAAIDDLNNTVTGTGFIDSITQTNGIVTATFKTLTADDVPDLTLSKISDAGSMASENKDDYITTSTTFTYTYDEEESEKTIQELVDYIAILEKRIEWLESPADHS